MARRRLLYLLATALPLGLGHPSVAEAQSVTPVQDLDFGVLMPGVVEVVTTADIWRRGEWGITAEGKYVITFLLPDALDSGTGALVPLVFGATDAALFFERTGRLVTFDPRSPYSINFSPGSGSRALLWLGGTVQPGVDQASGPYRATIVVVLSNSGV